MPRPMPRFADIRGQEDAHDLLRRAVARADRLPHAVPLSRHQGGGQDLDRVRAGPVPELRDAHRDRFLRHVRDLP